MTIPNILSVFRILLIPLFIISFFKGGEAGYVYAAGVLILSGLTDCLDGVIARKFHQISDLGKILDPLADKVTQVAVGLSLCIHFSNPWLVTMMVLIIIKELLMMIAAIILIRKGLKVRSSRWFGKVATFLFYAAVVAFVLFPNILSGMPMNIICIVISVTMIYALVRYVFEFFAIINTPANSGDVPAEKLQSNQGA